jgi:hypothetical protein
MLESIEQIIYGPALAGVALAVIAFELVVLVMAARRQRSGRAPLSLRLHAIAAGAIAALPMLGGISVHAARKLMFAAYSGSGIDPSEKASDLARGMSGQMNAIPFVVFATLTALALWVVGTTRTLSRPRSEGRTGSFPPVLLVGLGLVPTALGAMQWSVGVIKTFVSLAGVDPAEKGPILERQLDAGRHQLTLFARGSMIGIAVLAVLAVALIVTRARSDAAAAGASARPRSSRRLLALSAAAIALAGVLMFAARPLAAENDLPWPPSRSSEFVWEGGPSTPDVIGPDAPERAPVVTVFRDKVLLDAAPTSDFDDLESKLTTLATNFRLLHPGQVFNGTALIEADAATPIARLTSVLRAVHGVWYDHPLFVFTVKESQVRPVLGAMHRVTLSGARIRLGYTDDDEDDEEWKSATPLRLEDFPDYAAFARRLVELRRAGKVVLVKVTRR